MLNSAAPFVLLDDARPGGRARLYRRPERCLVARAPDEIAPLLQAVVVAQAAGRHVAGFLGYEAGAALHDLSLPGFPRTAPHRSSAASTLPLAWFGVFDAVTAVAGDAVADLLPDPAGAWRGVPVPDIGYPAYAAAFDVVTELIRAGDIYQANLTLRAAVPVAGSPLALFAAIRPQALAGHGALVWTGEDWLLSFSPELFFHIGDGAITARPMKGTALRDPDPVRDDAAAAALASDPKQRAENLMIVDLLRNDIAQVSVPGSVAVPERFTVERYPTVHQLVSSVTGRLCAGCDAADLVTALFPCGSITGAPKRRAMQVIAEVEDVPRGIYTGAIGHFAPDGTAQFNVAIRTLHLPAGADCATMGLGSGIVADSTAPEEWRECLAKGRFVAAGQRPFDLIETMAFDPRAGIPLLERHLDRMKESARALGFAFDRHHARNELQAATFRLAVRSRIRLLLARSGALAIEAAPAPPAPTEPVRVALAPLPVVSDDFRLRHKTTDRAFYDAARAGRDAFEVAFVDPEGQLTEGSFTSLFVERDGVLLTPPLDRGLLPGVLRAELLATGRAIEHPLTPHDCAQGLIVGNAVRGLIVAQLVAGGEHPR